MAVTVEYDVESVKTMLQLLPTELRDKAMAQAINKTADKAKAEMKRQIVALYNVKSTEVGGALFVSGAKASADIISASMYPTTLSGSRTHRAMNVIHFKQGTGAGDLLFQFKRAGAMKVIGPAGQASKPFIGNLGRTVFRRTGEPKVIATKGMHKGKLREPIEPVQVIDIPQMFNVRTINEAVLAKAQTDLLDEVDRSINYLLKTL